MDAYTVLICDDNPAVHNSLSSYFQMDGIQVLSAYDGRSALDQLTAHDADAVILDWMLPDLDGLDVLQQIRKKDETLPVLMLSARSDETDRVLGLELGADDYIQKPYSPREVVIRVKKAMKRHRLLPETKMELLTLAELTVQPKEHMAFLRGKEIKLSPKELDVLVLLMKNTGKIVTREQFLNQVWGYDYVKETRVVDTLIKRLRQKVMAEGVHFQITNVYGAGYRIEEKP